MKIKNFFSTVFLLLRKYPTGCESGNELDWMLKDCCPVCIANPIESLSNIEYQRKYPAKNTLHFGKTTIHLCDYHLKELKDFINKQDCHVGVWCYGCESKGSREDVITGLSNQIELDEGTERGYAGVVADKIVYCEKHLREMCPEFRIRTNRGSRFPR